MLLFSVIYVFIDLMVCVLSIDFLFVLLWINLFRFRCIFRFMFIL